MRGKHGSNIHIVTVKWRSAIPLWHVGHGDSLKKVAGNKLELILYKLTSTPLKGILLGTAVTAIIQSSSGDNSYGCRICKFRYDEGCAVNWYYHGRKYRNECHWLDPLSVLY